MRAPTAVYGAAYTAMSDSTRDTPTIHVIVHAVWWTAESGPALPAGAPERLVPYVTRYAQTLGVTVTAAGGTGDHLHLLFELPATRTLGEITSELQRATTRFVRETYQEARLFAWDASAVDMVSVGPDDAEATAEYVRNNSEHHVSGDLIAALEGYPDTAASSSDDDTPDWLREVMDFRRDSEQ